MHGRIVVVDDRPENLLMIEEYLADEPYSIAAFEDPRRALDSLQGTLDADVIVLDRMMPGLNGIELLREMRKIERFRRTPVIMQTAAATPQQVAEGLAEGIFYYLTKPFSRDVLKAIVHNALRDHETFAKLEQFLQKSDRALARVFDCRFTFRTPEEVDSISALLARMYPVPMDALIGIRELMLNAVEHGNLGITYAEKTRLQADGRWIDEINRRLALPEFRDRQARAILERLDHGIMLTIEDQGSGFDWTGYLSLDATRVGHTHGRGIAMSRAISFDDIRYDAPGNRVHALKIVPKAA